MKKEQVLGLVRHLLTIGGGIAVHKGIADETIVTEIVGGLITFIGVVWSIWSPDKKIGNGY